MERGSTARTPAWPGIVGLLLLAAVALLPLVAEALPVKPVAPQQALLAPTFAKLLILLVMAATFAVRGWLDHRDGIGPPATMLVFVLLGVGFTVWHWHAVDAFGENHAWQLKTYYGILNHEAEAPHQFRPLPYGFARILERLSGDWLFACLVYRWFFTTWFLWASYRLARLFHPQRIALIAVLLLLPFYPLSIKFYAGQLTDPMIHALFVLALVYVLEDRWLLLALTLALGVIAKETVVLLVPAYWACYWRGGFRALMRTILLGLACVLAFLAIRLPLGWRLSHEAINGTEEWMIASNLGIAELGYVSDVPLWHNYLHPLVFVGLLVPLVALRWNQLDPRLKALALVVVPGLLLSNLCFGWLYESRNYMPALPLLLTMALPVKPQLKAVHSNDTYNGGK
jgi:hypothetical protein